MMSSDKGLSLNVGGSTDPLAMVAAMANKSGGMDNLLPLLLIVVLLGGRSGLLGNNDPAAAAVAANNPAILQLMGKICDVEREICTSSSATRLAVDASADRIISSNNLQTSLIDSGFNRIGESITDNRFAMDRSFTDTNSKLALEFNNTNNAIASGFNSASKEMNCGFNRQNDIFNAYTRNLDTNLCNSFGKVYAQNSAIKCGIEKLSDKIDCKAAATDALILSSKNEVLQGLRDLETKAQLAAKDAEIARLKEKECGRFNDNVIVAINSGNNSINSLTSSVNNLVSMLSRPSNGNGNGNS